jgi:hypothetical protein
LHALPQQSCQKDVAFVERCRRMGVIRDRRLTAHGLRHAEYDRKDRVRFEAIVRFALNGDKTFERIQANFGYVLEEIDSLPISLELEAHPSDDKSVHVRCGLAVKTVDEAFVVANEAISQLRRRLRLEPIDFDSGEAGDEVRFEIQELVEASDDSPA